jgi:hypothetical protein
VPAPKALLGKPAVAPKTPPSFVEHHLQNVKTFENHYMPGISGHYRELTVACGALGNAIT